jgi:hypothetical protein
MASGFQTHFVIWNAVAMGLRPHLRRKMPRPATAFYRTATLSFVIPSEAEGSAVRGSFVEMSFDQSVAIWLFVPGVFDTKTGNPLLSSDRFEGYAENNAATS